MTIFYLDMYDELEILDKDTEEFRRFIIHHPRAVRFSPEEFEVAFNKSLNQTEGNYVGEVNQERGYIVVVTDVQEEFTDDELQHMKDEWEKVENMPEEDLDKELEEAGYTKERINQIRLDLLKKLRFEKIKYEVLKAVKKERLEDNGSQ